MRYSIFIFILCNCYLFGVEYHEYSYIKVQNFNASHFRESNNTDLAIITHGQTPGAIGPDLFYVNNNILITDVADWSDRRVITLDEDYGKDKQMLDFLIYYDSFYEVYNKIFFKYGDSIDIHDKTNLNKIASCNESIISSIKDFYYQDNTLFIFDEYFNLWAINDPGLDNDKNRRNIIKEDQVISNIKSGVYKGLTIDNKKRLYVDGKIQTLNLSIFYKYMNETFQNKKETPVIEITTKLENLNINKCNYINTDTDGNTYWAITYSAIAVLNLEGFLIDIIVIKDSNSSSVVTDSGDIYFLKYHEDSVDLNKIERHW